MQRGNVARKRMGGRFEAHPLISRGIDAQAVAPGDRFGKLPQPRAAEPRQAMRLIPAFHKGNVGDVVWDAIRPQNRRDLREILIGAQQALRKIVVAALQQADIALDVAGKILADVEKRCRRRLLNGLRRANHRHNAARRARRRIADRRQFQAAFIAQFIHRIHILPIAADGVRIVRPIHAIHHVVALADNPLNLRSCHDAHRARFLRLPFNMGKRGINLLFD